MSTDNNCISISEASNPYSNKKAHDFLRKLMLYQKRITITFKLDEYNYFATEIDSREIQKFNYQIGGSALLMLIGYIYSGEFDDSDVNPLNPLFEDGDNKSSEVNKQVFSILLERSYIPHIKPSIIDKPGQLTATFKGQFGTIILIMQRDEDTDSLMREYGLL